MIKFSFDLFLSTIGLIILAPLFAIIAILIKIDSSGPIFFRQERIGQNIIPFNIFKFRTMKIKQDSNIKITIGKDSRITKIGSILRKYKIDELPQLINVIKGEMSLVGPRPEVAEYVKYYSARDKQIVLSVKPGITDLASIKFRNENEILAKESNPEKAYIEKILPKKLAYCRFYATHQSLGLDVAIIIKTIKAVIV